MLKSGTASMVMIGLNPQTCGGSGLRLGVQGLNAVMEQLLGENAIIPLPLEGLKLVLKGEMDGF